MALPCDNRTICPCPDNPLANLSSEAADLERFVSVRWTPPGNPPPNEEVEVLCIAFAESSTSQLDADDEALRNSQDCVWDGWCTSGPICEPKPPPVFPNGEITCTDGDMCHTMDAGAVIALSQADADAIAASLCESRLVSNPQACPSPPLPPEPPDPPDNCPAEVGIAAPESLSITSLTEWEEWTVTPGQFSNYTNFGAGCGGVTRSHATPGSQLDHSPGTYGLRYESGYFRDTCPFAPFLDCVFGFNLYGLENDERNSDGPTPSCWRGLANVWRTMPGEPPPAGNSGSGHQDLYPDPGAAQAAITAFFANLRFTSDPYPPAESGVAFSSYDHSNTGGTMRIVSDSAPSFTPQTNIVLTLLQLAGQIPQPRKILISDYASKSAELADQSAATAWDGAFPTRSTYSGSFLQWDAASSGNFGGALAKYTMAHPTSANGKGWQLDIYSAGMILMWRGFKAVGDTSIGVYYKDLTTTPVGPGCMTCADDSDTQWFPGASPP